MITVISGTDRTSSHTAILAEYVVELVRLKTGIAPRLLDLTQLNPPLLMDGLYKPESQSVQLRDVQDQYITPASALYMVIPEYNGSFPGILKYFIDACSVRNYVPTFHGKKVAILGLSTGRAGNLRGLDHITGILQYLNIIVMPNRLPVSRVETLVQDGVLTDSYTQSTISAHVDEFINFCS